MTRSLDVDLGSDYGLALDLDERIRVVECSMAHYDERLDRGKVADLAGRHFPAVETAVEKTVSWGSEAETYLERVFGEPLQSNGLPTERRAGAPTQVVLPRNDWGDLAPYVLAPCALAGRPYAVRPSSREAGEYVARTFHGCLLEAVRETLSADRAESVVAAFDLLDPDEVGATELARVAPERVQLVLFGDDATLASLSTARDELTAGEDFAAPADEQLAAAREQLRAVHPGETLADDRLTVVECTATAPVREFPVPLLQVKRVAGREQLLDVMGGDFEERESLVTSVFTDDSATFDALAPELPATLVKHGRPTHDIDLFEPHQGRHLVADLL
jgi:hypothetical protein